MGTLCGHCYAHVTKYGNLKNCQVVKNISESARDTIPTVEIVKNTDPQVEEVIEEIAVPNESMGSTQEWNCIVERTENREISSNRVSSSNSRNDSFCKTDN